MRSHFLTSITVRKAPLGTLNDGLLTAGHVTYRCKLGKAGIKTRKLEGDNATPAGQFAIIGGFFRPDRLSHLNSTPASTRISADMCWCDDPQSACYNRLVSLPFRFSHEIMYRNDCLYDVCLVLDYNYSRRKKFAGSAIFMHLASADKSPTQGCIALDRPDMLKLLPRLSLQTRIEVLA